MISLNRQQKQLMAAIQDGLPLTTRPFLSLAKSLNLSEKYVIDTLESWHHNGLIKRMGLVVNHHNVGYRANAMVVWDIPNNQVDAFGEKIKQSGLTNLCYRRRRQPQWPYNLFCMLHGRDRTSVHSTLQTLIEHCNLGKFDYEVLYTGQQFKQCGGRYAGVSFPAALTQVVGESH